MPELPPTILKRAFNSKSSSSPPFQMQKVLPPVGFSAVVWPTMAPSSMRQNCGSPDQPVRSLPLNNGLKPSSSAAARTGAMNAARARVTRRRMDMGAGLLGGSDRYLTVRAAMRDVGTHLGAWSSGQRLTGGM